MAFVDHRRLHQIYIEVWSQILDICLSQGPIVITNGAIRSQNLDILTRVQVKVVLFTVIQD